MTEKQMNKFADIIANKVINRIKEFQRELDVEFHQDINSLNEVYDTTITALDQETIDEVNKVLLEQLEDNLKVALEEENYELAAELLKKIKDLKNRNN